MKSPGYGARLRYLVIIQHKGQMGKPSGFRDTVRKSGDRFEEAEGASITNSYVINKTSPGTCAHQFVIFLSIGTNASSQN
jgi:Na+-translocating ferredoxin:NAD+ oxidoreductase RnfG subunit